jgi:hypothetical protein
LVLKLDFYHIYDYFSWKDRVKLIKTIMAFVPMTPPPMMPDDIEDDEIEDFGQIDDEDEDSSCYDLTGRILCNSNVI